MANSPDRFEDERGVIQDLLGKIDSVTEIFTRKGAVRGNHVHRRTTQWTYVIFGKLQVSTLDEGDSPLNVKTKVYTQGKLFCEEPGVAHAWKALEDTLVLVFTRGPRSGAKYATDTYKLALPLVVPTSPSETALENLI